MKADQIKPSGIAKTLNSNGRVQTLSSPSTAIRSEAQLYDQGITYNEPGLTYNEIGIAYGGVYGAQDTRPLISLAQSIRPVGMKFSDIGSGTTVIEGNSGMLIGMLGMLYP